MSGRPTLLFVSPRFLLPADSGGQIRTSQILRGMKGGRFEIVLLSASTPEQVQRYGTELASYCDRQEFWSIAPRDRWFHLQRLVHITSALPIPVATDRSREARARVDAELARAPAVAVFDFAHAAVLAPDRLPVRSVLFTHNVEAEIFARHAAMQTNPVMRALWRSQHRKMVAFEGAALRKFDRVVAVSERDKQLLQNQYALEKVDVIPTGVDLDYFEFAQPAGARRVVFTGSMDSLANQDGISFFLEAIWPIVRGSVSDATMHVVGRAPPAALVNKAKTNDIGCTFSGWVPDVRPVVRGADVFVVPLRVGGGTRIKVYEAIAMGIPVVSTALGVEGLDIRHEEHYLQANSAEEFAAAVAKLLREPGFGTELAKRAREHVAGLYSNDVVARCFEEICLAACSDSGTRAQRSSSAVAARVAS